MPDLHEPSAASGPSEFRSVAPMLPTGPDPDAAFALFEAMGFTTVWRSGGGGAVRRGNVTFNVVQNDNREWADNTSLSIGVSGLDALYEEYRELPARVGKLEVKAWGRREFHMIVPSGVCLQFFEADD